MPSNLLQILKPEDIREVAERVNTELFPKYSRARGRRKDELLMRLGTYRTRLLSAYDTVTHQSLLATFPSEYHDRVLLFLDSIVKDYNCTTPLEISLATTITSNYFHSLLISQKLANQGSISHQLDIAYQNSLTKQLSQRTRLYHESLQTLQSLKTPIPKLNITLNK